MVSPPTTARERRQDDHDAAAVHARRGLRELLRDMVVLDHAAVVEDRLVPALLVEETLAYRMARGAALALAAVLIPGFAATCGCEPPRRTIIRTG
jgi:hypothetical protein